MGWGRTGPPPPPACRKRPQPRGENADHDPGLVVIGIGSIGSTITSFTFAASHPATIRHSTARPHPLSTTHPPLPMRVGEASRWSLLFFSKYSAMAFASASLTTG